MPKNVTVTLHPSFLVGEISPRLFATFLEPIANMVNGWMYYPGHPTADDKGFRTDVLNTLKDAGLKAVRMPGGNFVSAWDWKDSIGPKEQRKTHLEIAWHSIYDNQVGHDEFLEWAERGGFEPLYTINLGTGDINDAIAIVEYSNHEGGTYWSDLRRQNGHEKPYGVKMWYLGNEVDGPWQPGAWERDPKGYGIRANEVSKAMKWVDGSIETAVCVSCSPLLPHYPTWDMAVLEQCYESVDYVSMHYYHIALPDDYAALLGGSIYYEDYINTEIAICDYVQTKCRSPKKLMLSFDEYSSRFRGPQPATYGSNPTALMRDAFMPHYSETTTFRQYTPDSMRTMGTGRRRLGDMVDALGDASAQLAFLRHADRVKIGCQTLGLYALAQADKEHVWKPGGYYTYNHLLSYARGVSLLPALSGDTFDIPAYFVDDNTQFQAREGLSYLDTAAALDEETGELALFIINRNWEDETNTTIDMTGFKGLELIEHIEMYDETMQACDTYDHPDEVLPQVNASTTMVDGKINVALKKLSWNVLRFRTAQ